MNAAFAAIIAKARAEMDAAEQLVRDALAMPRPRLALVAPDGRARLLHRATYGAAYRVTDIDALGPVGHRDYTADDARGMAQEISQALRGGYAIRRDW